MIEAGATRIGASAGVRIAHGNGAGPERAYGTEAAEPVGHRTPKPRAHDVSESVIAAPRATIHRL
jgi:hypothetical protein